MPSLPSRSILLAIFSCIRKCRRYIRRASRAEAAGRSLSGRAQQPHRNILNCWAHSLTPLTIDMGFWIARSSFDTNDALPTEFHHLSFSIWGGTARAHQLQFHDEFYPSLLQYTNRKRRIHNSRLILRSFHIHGFSSCGQRSIRCIYDTLLLLR